MATVRVDISPSILQWALQRADKQVEDLSQDLQKRVPAWLRREQKPTLKQLEAFARTVHVPFGYLFLSTPPTEAPLEIPDFRTERGVQRTQLSLELRETLLAAERRQEWYREYLLEQDAEPLAFVGAAKLSDNPNQVAASMRRQFRMTAAERAKIEVEYKEDYRNALISRFEEQGILVCIDGYVGTNTKRGLNLKEFRGFVLSDEYAPLILVNGKDWPAAQLFTLAHECAHLYLGQDALVDLSPFQSTSSPEHSKVERWCNQVAAEFLVPLEELPKKVEPMAAMGEVVRLSRDFKVSRLVITQRLHDRGAIEKSVCNNLYRSLVREYVEWADTESGGGNSYRTRLRKVGKRFAKAVLQSAGRAGLPYTEAFRLLNVKNTKGLDEIRGLLS